LDLVTTSAKVTGDFCISIPVLYVLPCVHLYMLYAKIHEIRFIGYNVYGAVWIMLSGSVLPSA
jgi:hypothetical protein